jgi:hypothetical protein
MRFTGIEIQVVENPHFAKELAELLWNTTLWKEAG